VDRKSEIGDAPCWPKSTNGPRLAPGRETSPMLKVVDQEALRDGEDLPSSLDGIAREGARRMLMAALMAEVDEHVERYAGLRDEEGHALVVRNGVGKARRITTGAGTFEVKAPRVNDRRVEGGVRCRFTSKILPPYMRRSPKIGEVLPILYLRGLSTGDFKAALPVLLGEEASGLSATTIARLTGEWQQEYDAFRARKLADRDYVYVWVDGVHFNVRLEDERLCTLVMIGVRPDGTKELIAVDDGYRESTDSWATLLRRLREAGMRAPVVAVGDGALGFWKAAAMVWPETKHQQCWFHRLGNVLDKLPKGLQPKAKKALQDIMNAESKKVAEAGIAHFVAEYQAKYPKAVQSLTRDQEELLTFFSCPAEHWRHLRTTNIIESPFATVRLRQRVTKGAGSRNKALLMAFKLLDMSQARWRRINGADLLPLVREGAKFIDGIRQERGTQERKGRAA
jgi:putative transposase